MRTIVRVSISQYSALHSCQSQAEEALPLGQQDVAEAGQGEEENLARSVALSLGALGSDES